MCVFSRQTKQMANIREQNQIANEIKRLTYIRNVSFMRNIYVFAHNTTNTQAGYTCPGKLRWMLGVCAVFYFYRSVFYWIILALKLMR